MSAGPLRQRLESSLNQVWLGRGPAAVSLLPVAWLYGAVTSLRRAAYRHGWLHSVRSGVPVIVVGNRIVGGAGKTPTVLAIVQRLKDAGWQPGIVSRGHGRADSNIHLVTSTSTAAEVGDEPLLLHRRGGVPVAVGQRRSEVARALLAAHPGIDCLVADDGLQHLAWARDIEVVLFDARGAGNGWLLPAGPLREPIDAPGAGRALLRLYSAGERSTPLPGFIAQRTFAGLVTLEAWQRGETASHAAFAGLRQSTVHACAGIAQPQRFFDMLHAAGLTVQPHALADHDDYAVLPWPLDAQHVIVTEKDAVKLDPARLATERPNTTVWIAPLDFEPEPAFWSALDEALGPRPPGPAAFTHSA